MADEVPQTKTLNEEKFEFMTVCLSPENIKSGLNGTFIY